MNAPPRFTYFETLIGFGLADRRFKRDANYMVMHSYWDESGTHGADSPAVIVAGFAATAAQWVGFEKRQAKLFSDFGVNTFHAKKLRGNKGDFKDWEPGEKAKFNYRFLKMIDDQLSFGVASAVAPEDYKQHYGQKTFPRKLRRDSQYGLLFRLALGRSILFMKERPQSDWPLNVVMELGHPNWQDAARVFNEVKSIPRNSAMLGTISFAAKSDCALLAVADSLAYAMFRTTAGYAKHPDNPDAVPIGPSDPPYYAHVVPTRRVILRKKDLLKFYRDHRDGLVNPRAASSKRRPS
jgi:hypothetical protein